MDCTSVQKSQHRAEALGGLDFSSSRATVNQDLEDRRTKMSLFALTKTDVGQGADIAPVNGNRVEAAYHGRYWVKPVSSTFSRL